jgi:hypothetical protein
MMKKWEFQGGTVADGHDTSVFGFYLVSENALWGTENIGQKRNPGEALDLFILGGHLIYFVIPCRRDYLLAAFICLEIMSHPSLRGKPEFLQVFPQNPLIPTKCLGQPRFSRLFMVMSCQLCHFCYRSRMGQSRSPLKYFQWPFQPEIGGTYHKKKAYFLGLYDSRIAPKILGFIMIWCSTSVLGS